jgi:hypothetical protein
VQIKQKKLIKLLHRRNQKAIQQIKMNLICSPSSLKVKRNQFMKKSEDAKKKLAILKKEFDAGNIYQNSI